MRQFKQNRSSPTPYSNPSRKRRSKPKVVPQLPERDYSRTQAEEAAWKIIHREPGQAPFTPSEGAIFTIPEAELYAHISRTAQSRRGVKRQVGVPIQRSVQFQQEVVQDMAALRRVKSGPHSTLARTPTVYEIAAIAAQRYPVGSVEFQHYIAAMEAVFVKSKHTAFQQQPTNLLRAISIRVRGKSLPQCLNEEFQRARGILTVEKLSQKLGNNPTLRTGLSTVLRLMETVGMVKGYSHYTEERKSKTNWTKGQTTAWIPAHATLPKGSSFPETEILQRLTLNGVRLSELHFPFKSRGKLWGNPDAKTSYKQTLTTIQILKRVGAIQTFHHRVGNRGYPTTYVQLTQKGAEYAREIHQGNYPEEMRKAVNEATLHNSRKR